MMTSAISGQKEPWTGGGAEPMNVVHVFPYTPMTSGGHSNAIRGFIECQRAVGINAAGVAPRAEGSAGSRSQCDFPFVEFASWAELRWESLRDWFKLAPTDSLIHLHSVSRDTGRLSRRLRRAGIPYVCTGHGHFSYESFWHWLQKFVYLHSVNWGPRGAGGLHLLTRAADRGLKFLLPRYSGVRFIQGNVFQMPDFTKLPAATRASYGVPEAAVVLVYMGRLDVWTKGLDLVLKAFSRLPPNRFWLVMAGPDWNGGSQELQTLATRLECRSRVVFPGPVYGEKKWALLRMADLFVSPSRRDAFPIALTEALAAGRPTITSTVTALAPDLRRAEAALLVPLAVEPLAAAIHRAFGDRELLQGLGVRGANWAHAQCDSGRAGPRFREFYEAVLQRRQRRLLRL